MFMKRYQVYLNQNSVGVLDDFEDRTNLERSAMIRMAINTLAQNMRSLIIVDDFVGDLDSIIGVIKAKSKLLNSSGRVDDIYYDK